MHKNNDSLIEESERGEVAGTPGAEATEETADKRRAGSRVSARTRELREFRKQVFILLFLTGFYEKAEREPQARLYLEDVELPRRRASAFTSATRRSRARSAASIR